MMIFNRTPEFEREFKALGKRWPSLPKDLAIAERLIETLYVDQESVDRILFCKNFFNSKRAAILSSTQSCEAVKMRMDCASLGSKDSVRLVFIYIFDGTSVLLVELYSKTDKNREDTDRLRKYIAGCG